MTKIKTVKCVYSQLANQCYRIRREHILAIISGEDINRSETVYTIVYDTPYLLLEDFDDTYKRRKQRRYYSNFI